VVVVVVVGTGSPPSVVVVVVVTGTGTSPAVVVVVVEVVAESEMAPDRQSAGVMSVTSGCALVSRSWAPMALIAAR
jgi:hypothetical protein